MLSQRKEVERVFSRSVSSSLVGNSQVVVRLAAASVSAGGESGFRGRVDLDGPAVLDDQRHRAVAQRAEQASNVAEHAIVFGRGGGDGRGIVTALRGGPGDDLLMADKGWQLEVPSDEAASTDLWYGTRRAASGPR